MGPSSPIVQLSSAIIMALAVGEQRAANSFSFLASLFYCRAMGRHESIFCFYTAMKNVIIRT